MYSRSGSDTNFALVKKNSLNSSSRLIISEDQQKTLYSCLKKIDSQLFKLKFFTQNQRLYLNLVNSTNQSYTLPVPTTISSQGHTKILSYLNTNGPEPYFSLQPWELFEKRSKKFSTSQISIEFWYNPSLQILRVHSQCLSKDFPIEENLKKIQKLTESLYTQIKLRNNEVFFEDFKETCLGQTVKQINNEAFFIRILREKSEGRSEDHSSYIAGWNIRIQIFRFDGEEFGAVFSLDEICEKFLTDFENLDEKICEIFGRVELKGKKVVFSRNSSKVMKIVKVFGCNKKILNTYAVAFYQIVEIPGKLLLTAELRLNFKEFFCLAVGIEEGLTGPQFFSHLLQDLTIRKKKICIVKKDLNCFHYSAIQIQKLFRCYLAKKNYSLLKSKSIRPKIVFISGKVIGNLSFKVLIKRCTENLSVTCYGDISAELTFPLNSLIDSNYRLIVQSLYIQDGKIEINSNLLTVFQKNLRFSLPSFLAKHKKVFDKWKPVLNDYCRVSIYELGDEVVILIDTKFKIYSKKELMDIYHEISYESIYEEVTLKDSEIFLDPALRPVPILILSRKLYQPDSFVSVTLKEQLSKDLLKQKVLVFDVTLNSHHYRLVINIDQAESKTGIPKQFTVALSNYLISQSLKTTQQSVVLDLNIPKLEINKKVNSLQRVFRGYLVRKNIGKILVSDQNYLVAVKKQKVSGIDMMLFAYVQKGKIRIEAIDKDSRLVLYLENNLVQGFGDERKKIIEDLIFGNLFIDGTGRMMRLCIDTYILQKPQRKARKLSLKQTRKATLKVSFSLSSKP